MTEPIAQLILGAPGDQLVVGATITQPIIGHVLTAGMSVTQRAMVKRELRKASEAGELPSEGSILLVDEVVDLDANRHEGEPGTPASVHEILKQVRDITEGSTEEVTVTQPRSAPDNRARRLVLLEENRLVRADVTSRRQGEVRKSKLRRFGERLIRH